MTTLLLRDGPPIWGWGPNEESETWEGPFDTREEAEAFGNGHGFVVEAQFIDTEKCADEVAGDLLDGLVERMNEIEELSWSEDPIFFEYTDTMNARLLFRTAIAKWAKEHVSSGNAWMATGVAIPVRVSGAESPS